MEETFDTDREERQGAWVVLAMFGVAAALPPVTGLWIFAKLESSTATTDVGALLGGLTALSMAGIALAAAGAVLVVYGVARFKMHGPLYVLGGVLATALPLTPILLGWNEVANIPPLEDFDPGSCAKCGGDGPCVEAWPARGPRISGRGECLSGRRVGEWVFGSRTKPNMATFHFHAGRRDGPFETELVRGSFDDGVRDGEWVWLRGDEVVARGQYVGGEAQGRWSCLASDGDELSWVLFDRGKVVDGTGDVYRGSFVIAADEAKDETHLDGIRCEPDEGVRRVDYFERMIWAEP